MLNIIYKGKATRSAAAFVNSILYIHASSVQYSASSSDHLHLSSSPVLTICSLLPLGHFANSHGQFSSRAPELVIEGVASAVQSIHMKRFSAAGCAWAVFLVCLLAHEVDCGITFILGGVGVGWTNTANIDYNQWLSNYKIKIGDTLSFVNYDTIDHSIVLVDKLGYDTCLETGKKLSSVTTIGPSISYSFPLSQSGQGYVICAIPGHCVQGMKVFVQVLNADGSVNQTAAAADAPKANSASAMPEFSLTSQLLIVLGATGALVVAAIPMFA